MKRTHALWPLCLLLLTPGVLCAAGRNVMNPDEPEKEPPMTANAEAYPNYVKHPDCPRLTGAGIDIALKGSTFARDAAIPLRGAYFVDQAFLHRAGGEPLTRILLILVRRDAPGGAIDVLQGSHNLAPASGEAPAAGSSSALTGGYFNLNLRDYTNVIVEPGRYWVMVSMGDHVSKRLEFEVVARP